MAIQHEERFPYKVMELNGITYLPHYYNEEVFVGPAYSKTLIAYSGKYLRDRGALERTMYLWRRGIAGVVKNVMT